MPQPPEKKEVSLSQEEVTLVGTIERIVYEQPETGFLIASFLVEDAFEPITIKGTIFNVAEQSILEVKGRWEVHKVYGQQLAVQEFAPVLPQSLLGIERYLTAEIPGIGKKIAQKIVQEFGTETFKIIDESPTKLLKIPKFTKKKLQQLLEVWEEKKEQRGVLTFLHQAGVSSAQAHKIFQHFGLNAIPELKSNPYQLTEMPGFGFKMADQIAQKMGFDENSPQRASAGALYVLTQLSLNGHTCYPKNSFIEKTVEDLKIAPPIVTQAVQQLLQDRLMRSKTLSLFPQTSPVEVIAHPRLYQAERRIAEGLIRILKSEAYTPFEHPEPLIAGLEQKIGIQLDGVQREAVAAALQHKVLIITGGPGTGKTTIIRFILELVKAHIPHISLAAPTGRAAKRMAEANGRSASTIHRLLGASRLGFEKDQDNPIDSELVIIDEISMIDTLLMASLLDAIRSESRLILVGDVDQLPSVGPGSVLLNLILSELIAVVRLEKVFRQAKDSLITVNAHKVRTGICPALTAPKSGPLLDFYFVKEQDPHRVVEKIITLATERIPNRFDFDPKTDIQVLTPMHRGVTGAVFLNQQLQQHMNPESQFLQANDQIFKVGDKVLQQQNDYDKEVFNGDLGVILHCDPKARQLKVQYESHAVDYQSEELEQLTLAYAITVHKSQGSEYPAVILPLTTHHYVMLQRNLVYTAMTRGKKLVVIVGMENALELAINNASPALRYTTLQSKFQEAWQQETLI